MPEGVKGSSVNTKQSMAPWLPLALSIVKAMVLAPARRFTSPAFTQPMKRRSGLPSSAMFTVPPTTLAKETGTGAARFNE